jgi:hypothetical protein
VAWALSSTTTKRLDVADVLRCGVRTPNPNFYIVRWNAAPLGQTPIIDRALVEVFHGKTRSRPVLWCYFCDPRGGIDDCAHVGLVRDYMRAIYEPTGEEKDD